jgi:hypothetical protein
MIADDIGLVRVEPAAERYDAWIGHTDQETSAAAVARYERKPIRAVEAWRKRDIRPVNGGAVILDNFVVR